MKYYLAVLIVLLGLGAGAFALLRDTDGPEQETGNRTEDMSSTGSEERDEAAPATVTITYTDSGFDAETYEIAAGGTVTIINNASSDLEFSSDNHPTHTKNPELNTSVLSPGQSTQITIGRPGSWGVHDHLNAQHTATLIVH